MPVIAIVGAFAVAVVNYLFAWKQGVTPSRLVLIGIGISMAMSALTMFLLLSGPAYLAAQVLNWMTGSLYGTNWSYIMAIWPWIVVIIPLSLLYYDSEFRYRGDPLPTLFSQRPQNTLYMMSFSKMTLRRAEFGSYIFLFQGILLTPPIFSS